VGNRRRSSSIKHAHFVYHTRWKVKKLAAGLKRLKHPQGDLFVIDALDVAIKDDMASMEHPFYSLSKNPVKEIKPYDHNGMKIEFRPSFKGFPTIYDKDLIIYAISHVIAKMEEGEEPPELVGFDPYEFLVFTERATGGRAYEALCDSVERLKGSYFKTNIRINGEVIDDWQGIIDGATMITDEDTKRPKRIEIRLSKMVLETIKNKSVLTLNRNYFRLKKPIERRVYELVRKHMGQQSSWSPYLKTLFIKSGSRGSLREFRRSIKELAESNHLPDFFTQYDPENDQVTFTPRSQYAKAFTPETPELPPLQTWAYEKAKPYLSRELSVYQAEIDWREHWFKSGCLPLDNPSAAFIGYCKKVGKF
jgi:hypothetical protein